jgi:hypothetical protein
LKVLADTYGTQADKSKSEVKIACLSFDFLHIILAILPAFAIIMGTFPGGISSALDARIFAKVWRGHSDNVI